MIGNPLIAITMLRHDVTAGLFAPVELLITEEENGRSALTYVVPSSLMVVEPNEPLRAAALELDAKLAALASEGDGGLVRPRAADSTVATSVRPLIFSTGIRIGLAIR